MACLLLDATPSPPPLERAAKKTPHVALDQLLVEALPAIGFSGSMREPTTTVRSGRANEGNRWLSGNR
jgi:hypothetical protein